MTPTFISVDISLFVCVDGIFSLHTLEVKVFLSETYFAEWVRKSCMVSGTEGRLPSDVLLGAGLHQSADRKASLRMHL